MKSINRLLKNRILLITTLNLTTNPRLTKEAELAAEVGASVRIICFKFNNWSENYDKVWIKENPDIDVYKINAGRSPFLVWLISSLLERMCQMLYMVGFHSISIQAIASNKRSYLLNRFLSHHRTQFKSTDLILAHNLGSLYPAWNYAQRNKIDFIFDVEDFHPGELILKDQNSERMRRKFILSELLPDAASVSFASPLIMKSTVELVGTLKNKVVILNSFPLKLVKHPESTEPYQKRKERLRLVWFSQKISFGRGLEQFLKSLAGIEEPMEVTLIGDPDPRFLEEKLLNIENVSMRITGPLDLENIFKELQQNHIGLALEDNGVDLNRKLCLTNKIIAYTQAGLYILATNTPAQSDFIHEDPDRGMLCEHESDEIQIAIGKMHSDIDKIIAGRDTRHIKAQQISWENESSKVLKVWSRLLDEK